MKNNRLLILLLIVSSFQIACGDPYAGFNIDVRKNAKLVSIGKDVYSKNCVTCHKAKGAGDPNWRKRDKEGFLRAPPLNGDAHTWHHSAKWLIKTIRDGSVADAKGIKGKMPAWKNSLSDQQVIAVVAYIQSLWSEEIFQRWLKIDARG